MNRKKSKKHKALRHQLAQQRATLKKRRASSKKRKIGHLIQRQKNLQDLQQAITAKTINKQAPANFSFVDNTDEILTYFNDCKTTLHKNKKIAIDISQIENLSSDAIALLVAAVHAKSFTGNYGKVEGNAPQNQALAKLFIESGFYRYVDADKRLKLASNTKENLLHKESNFNVQPDLAKNACQYGTTHVLNQNEPFPVLFEMLIEAMSNTNNHADKIKKGTIKWWLYAYNAHDENKTCYTFIDLGVGIFDSLPVGRYKKLTNLIGFTHNADLVQDLLDGKIKSSEKQDRDIRGKGIPQIARNSASEYFGRAFIISNNVKINLKDRTTEKLSENFKGTMLYWELINPKTE